MPKSIRRVAFSSSAKKLKEKKHHGHKEKKNINITSSEARVFVDRHNGLLGQLKCLIKETTNLNMCTPHTHLLWSGSRLLKQVMLNKKKENVHDEAVLQTLQHILAAYIGCILYTLFKGTSVESHPTMGRKFHLTQHSTIYCSSSSSASTSSSC